MRSLTTSSNQSSNTIQAVQMMLLVLIVQKLESTTLTRNFSTDNTPDGRTTDIVQDSLRTDGQERN